MTRQGRWASIITKIRSVRGSVTAHFTFRWKTSWRYKYEQ